MSEIEVAGPLKAAVERIGAEFRRLQSETRAGPCPCDCGNTIGDVLGDGVVNVHMAARYLLSAL